MKISPESDRLDQFPPNTLRFPGLSRECFGVDTAGGEVDVVDESGGGGRRVRMSRALRWIGVGVFAACVLGVGGAQALAEGRPNILWICADDHAPYVCGAYGNTQVHTPNIDRLAAQGIRFDRAYCNSPVCTASRASFITGRYPRTVGVTALSTPLPASETTLAEMLKAAGYATASFGKMHFNSNLKHGFDLRLDLEDHAADLKKRGAQPLPQGVEVQPPWKPFKDPARIWLNSFYHPLGAVDEDMDGTWFARQAEKYLTEKRDEPFFLMVSFYEPHSPFRFPVEYRNRHDPKEFQAPKPGPEDDWQIPREFRDLTESEKQGIIAAYYTSTEFMDKNVGIVLAALERSGKAANTLVIYTGDHGYMLGQHGRFEKHCSFEPAIRSPLLFRYPGKIQEGSATAALTEFIDIAPTALEFCGVDIPATVQGRSLVPLVTGKTKTNRDQVEIEYAENEEAAIRTEKWKLVYISGKRERQDGYKTGQPLPRRKVLLFDEVNDPDEMTNVADRSENASLVADLMHRLADHLFRTAREPQLLPNNQDVYQVLDFCVRARDVPAPRRGIN